MLNEHNSYTSSLNSHTFTAMNIPYLIAGQIVTLVVYGTPHCSYQYQILFSDGSLSQPQELYPTAEAALNLGLDEIKLVKPAVCQSLVNNYQLSDD